MTEPPAKGRKKSFFKVVFLYLFRHLETKVRVTPWQTKINFFSRTKGIGNLKGEVKYGYEKVFSLMHFIFVNYKDIHIFYDINESKI